MAATTKPPIVDGSDCNHVSSLSGTDLHGQRRAADRDHDDGGRRGDGLLVGGDGEPRLAEQADVAALVERDLVERRAASADEAAVHAVDRRQSRASSGEGLADVGAHGDDADRGDEDARSTTWAAMASGATAATTAAAAAPIAPNIAKKARWCNSTATSSAATTIHTTSTPFLLGKAVRRFHDRALPPRPPTLRPPMRSHTES